MCKRRGDNPAAAEHFRTALECDPADDEIRAGMVALLSRTGQLDEAVQLARRGLAIHDRAPGLHLSLGKALVAAGRFDQAIVALDRARELTADSAAEPAATSSGVPPEQQLAVEHVAGNRDLAAAACYEMAVAQLQLGQLAEAEQNLDRVLRLDPKSALAYFQIGNLRHARGDLPGALQCYRLSLDLQSEFAPAYCNLATVLLLTGDVAHARKAYERALALAPDDASTHFNLGLLLLGENQAALAREHLLRARELGITLPPALEAQLQPGEQLNP